MSYIWIPYSNQINLDIYDHSLRYITLNNIEMELPNNGCTRLKIVKETMIYKLLERDFDHSDTLNTFFGVERGALFEYDADKKIFNKYSDFCAMDGIYGKIVDDRLWLWIEYKNPNLLQGEIHIISPENGVDIVEQSPIFKTEAELDHFFKECIGKKEKEKKKNEKCCIC